MLEQDPRIDAALGTYPLAPIPPTLHRRVMVEVRRLQAGQHPVQPVGVKYRLDFLDLVLPVFFAFFGLMILAVPLGALALLDPLRSLELRFYLQAFFTSIPTLSIGLIGVFAIFGIVGTAGALLAAAVWLAPSQVELLSR